LSETRDPLVARVGDAERRLADHARGPLPPGLTDPDPGAEERWEAGQVWAHVAEFPGYWLGQVRSILTARAAGAAEPIPFGRTRTDPGRIAAIERDRRTDPAALLTRVRSSLTEAVDTMRALPDTHWAARGLHPSRGEMAVSEILERFVVAHLEEHADQLDTLRNAPR